MSSRSREPVSSYGYGVFTDTIIIAIDGGSRTSSQTAEQILGTSSSITWQETLTLFALFSLSLSLSDLLGSTACIDGNERAQDSCIPIINIGPSSGYVKGDAPSNPILKVLMVFELKEWRRENL